MAAAKLPVPRLNKFHKEYYESAPTSNPYEKEKPYLTDNVTNTDVPEPVDPAVEQAEIKKKTRNWRPTMYNPFHQRLHDLHDKGENDFKPSHGYNILSKEQREERR